MNDRVEELNVHSLSPTTAVPVAPAAGSIPNRLFTAELARRVGFRTLLLAVIVGPSSSFFVIDGRNFDWTREPLLRLVDAPLLVLAALQLLPVLRQMAAVPAKLRARSLSSSDAAVALFASFVAWVGLAWAMQPRAVGALMVLRLVGALSISALVPRLTADERRVLLKTLIALVAFEGALCVAQLIKNTSVGFGALGELGDPFNRTGPWRAPMGTSYYPYPLAAIALLTLGLTLWGLDRGLVSWRWGVVCALGTGVIVGSGYSVVGAAITVVIVGAFVVRRLPAEVALGPSAKRFRGAAVNVLVVFLLALVVTGVSLDEGWRWKGDRSTSGEVAQASSGRSDQIAVGLAMAQRWPVFGIGAGNFAVVREAHHEFDKVAVDAQITHSMPVLIAVEAGFPALALFGLTLLAATWRQWRRQLVMLAAMSGFLVGDLMHWYTGFGMLQIGVWVGFLLVRDDARESRGEVAV